MHMPVDKYTRQSPRSEAAGCFVDIYLGNPKNNAKESKQAVLTALERLRSAKLPVRPCYPAACESCIRTDRCPVHTHWPLPQQLFGQVSGMEQLAGTLAAAPQRLGPRASARVGARALSARVRRRLLRAAHTSEAAVAHAVADRRVAATPGAVPVHVELETDEPHGERLCDGQRLSRGHAAPLSTLALMAYQPPAPVGSALASTATRWTSAV
jgi:hypothetical protein